MLLQVCFLFNSLVDIISFVLGSMMLGTGMYKNIVRVFRSHVLRRFTYSQCRYVYRNYFCVFQYQAVWVCWQSALAVLMLWMPWRACLGNSRHPRSWVFISKDVSMNGQRRKVYSPFSVSRIILYLGHLSSLLYLMFNTCVSIIREHILFLLYFMFSTCLYIIRELFTFHYCYISQIKHVFIFLRDSFFHSNILVFCLKVTLVRCDFEACWYADCSWWNWLYCGIFWRGCE
jgi:hypothetical protein